MIYGSEAFEKAILAPHEVKFRGSAYLGGRMLEPDLPLVDGSVDVDRSRFVRRQCSGLQFAERYSGARRALRELLERPGVEIQIRKGVRYPSGAKELLPLHRGLIDVAEGESTGQTITASSPDIGMRVSYDKFLRPRAASERGTVTRQIESLVLESVPHLTGFRHDLTWDPPVPRVTWDRNRDEAVSQLALAAAAETWASPDGGWVLRHARSTRSRPSWTVSAGVNLTKTSRTVDWSKVRNAWAVSSESSEGTSYSAIARDVDPSSATWVGGPLGQRAAFYSSPLMTSTAQCRTTAHALLSKHRGARITVSFEGIGHPGLEAGDAILIVTRESVLPVVLDKFSIGLKTATITDAQTRMLPDDEEVSE